MTARSVEALVVGAHAVAFHAKPRFTKNFDLLVEPSEDNARRLLLALDDFGFGSPGLEVADFATAGKVVQLGIAPARIDIATSIDGLSFEEAWAGRVAGSYGGQRVWYLGKPELTQQGGGRPAAGSRRPVLAARWLVRSRGARGAARRSAALAERNMSERPAPGSPREGSSIAP